MEKVNVLIKMATCYIRQGNNLAQWHGNFIWKKEKKYEGEFMHGKNMEKGVSTKWRINI